MKKVVLASTAIFLSGCVATMPPIPGVPGAPGAGGIAGMLVPAGSAAGTTNGGAALSTAFDQLKVLNKPMTAKELFASQGVYSLMGSLQQMQKNPGQANSMAANLMGAAQGDTASLLRIAIKLTASYLSYSALAAILILTF